MIHPGMVHIKGVVVVRSRVIGATLLLQLYTTVAEQKRTACARAPPALNRSREAMK
jgi:hypothetical protein